MKSKNTGKKISIFNFLIFLVLTSVILLIYINNIITVNQLSAGNNELREEIKRNVQTNNLLVTEAERLSSFENISSAAFAKHNLIYKEDARDQNKLVVLKKSQLK